MIGAEWVLYLLLICSVFSVALIMERLKFFRTAARGQDAFRSSLRQATLAGRREEALRIAEARIQASGIEGADLEANLAVALLSHAQSGASSTEVLQQVAQDAVMRAKLHWDRNLAMLATIGSNAPFVGLFGTVLGIIKAFHDLSQQASSGAQTVTAGISEALVATAVGILVAIPAVVAFNLCQRRVKAALTQAEALKSFLISRLSS